MQDLGFLILADCIATLYYNRAKMRNKKCVWRHNLFR